MHSDDTTEFTGATGRFGRGADPAPPHVFTPQDAPWPAVAVQDAVLRVSASSAGPAAGTGLRGRLAEIISRVPKRWRSGRGTTAAIAAGAAALGAAGALLFAGAVSDDGNHEGFGPQQPGSVSFDFPRDGGRGR